MAEYIYKQEGDKFVLYADGAPLTNPDNVVITTSNEKLAKDLVAELKAGRSYTSPASLLDYHYTYCNLEQQDFAEFVEQFCHLADYERLIWDDYLMFHQESAVKQSIASYLAEFELPEQLRSYNLYQLTAILIVWHSYGSLMLAYYIITNICIPLAKKDADYESLKADFLEGLKDYECEVFEYNHTSKSYKRRMKDTASIIDAFVYYFNL